MKINKGFTLIEMMITVAIIGILTAIAMPSYREYVLRSHRTEATAKISEIQLAQERFFTVNNRYADSLVDLAIANASGASARTENGYYLIQITALNASTPIASGGGYSLTAAPQAAGGQSYDRCGTLSLNSLGVKGQASGISISECWK
ncbi:type IV pilin protein [Craterilacuibacter sinensis]|uniref:Prepilin-type N-terminal cleavage/methylation domain-containing protein n=1 Tax=Craterilacuibacter sinensis TaxID=2686017 RepID=A0A845BR53_9NEIS|nr:type IV pilin protein [Craterilacuibacter sinensis]MXR37714.1 prepilin-type N-terminal cleavage/methylation domain-containing protein [Craterilacuibacter sinensis]